MIALIGTPRGSFTSGASIGLLLIGAVKRLFGCAALSGLAGVQGCPRQSRHSAGAGPLPSHHTSPSGVRATFVKIVSRVQLAMALGFEFQLVPGATPK